MKLNRMLYYYIFSTIIMMIIESAYFEIAMSHCVAVQGCLPMQHYVKFGYYEGGCHLRLFEKLHPMDR